MRWFTSCQPLSNSEQETIEHTQDGKEGARDSSKSKWREYEKNWEDPNGNWEGKIYVKKWSSNGWNSTDGKEDQLNEDHQTKARSSDDQYQQRPLPFFSSPLSRMNDENASSPALIKHENSDLQDILDNGQPPGQGRLHSRNMVILDTMIRSSYKAGYNDALKIKPFLPYSSTSTFIPNNDNNDVEPLPINSRDNSNYLWYLGGFTILITTGLLTYSISNRLKNVERGLEETLALISLRDKNDLNGLNKLNKEILGIRKLIEDNNNNYDNNNGTSNLKSIVSGIPPNKAIDNLNKKNIENVSLSLLKENIETMKNDFKKEFRMIAKDFNGNQNDLLKIKMSLENIQTCITPLTMMMNLKKTGNENSSTNSSTNLREIINRVSIETHNINDKINKLNNTLNRDLSGEISLNNQFLKNNSIKIDNIQNILSNLEKDVKELKDKSITTKSSRSKSGSGTSTSASSSTSTSSSSSENTPLPPPTPAPAPAPAPAPLPSSPAANHSSSPTSTSTATPSSASPYGNRLMNSIRLNVQPGATGLDTDIMPFSDIRKAIEGVKKSYLDDQSKTMQDDGKPEQITVEPKLVEIPDTLEEENGPKEGIQFSTPLDKVKNPYLASSLKRDSNDVDFNVNHSTLKNSVKKKNESNNDDDDSSNSPPPPPSGRSTKYSAGSNSNTTSSSAFRSKDQDSTTTSSSSSSRPSSFQTRVQSPRSQSTHQAQQRQHEHWWTFHSLPSSSSLGLNDQWRIKGFGWYQPSNSSSSSDTNKVHRSNAKDESNNRTSNEDRSIGAWAVSRVRRRFGDWPFH
ncbi:uncharacterized protein L201_001407 [Kwoniella dendrophila CBS 6074]|uniref:Peroxin-14 n=1 Tax=Kwoniella dendrophila CBS 6074 TaxID=1295534 RepID=A0AAX4JM92_9TREE